MDLVAPQKFAIRGTTRQLRLPLPGLEDALAIPVEEAVYVPSGVSEARHVEIVFLGFNQVCALYWSRRRGEAVHCGTAPILNDLSEVAADIWLRVHFEVVRRHFFKKVYWLSVFGSALGLSRDDPERRDKAVKILQREGRRRCGQGIPAAADLIADMHFAPEHLVIADPEGAGRFLEMHAEEIALTEYALLQELGLQETLLVRKGSRIRHQGQRIGNPQNVLPWKVEEKATAFDKLLRSRLGRLRRRAQKDGLDPAAVHFEALLRTIESMNQFHEDLLRQLSDHLSPLACRLFRLLHISGPRGSSGATIPVPVIWSDPLRSVASLVMGWQPKSWATEKLVIAPDLLAVLDGDDPGDPRFLPAVHLAVGLLSVLGHWTESKRGAQRENRRNPREILYGLDPNSVAPKK